MSNSTTCSHNDVELEDLRANTYVSTCLWLFLPTVIGSLERYISYILQS